ncbi:helix-turn-helix domain-containing protein [Streptomyces sp. NPDC003011]
MAARRQHTPPGTRGAPGRLTPSDISERSGITLSTAHHLVASGALQRGADGRYQVGIRSLVSPGPVRADPQECASVH